MRHGAQCNQRKDFYRPLVLVLHFAGGFHFITPVETDNALSALAVSFKNFTGICKLNCCLQINSIQWFRVLFRVSGKDESVGYACGDERLLFLRLAVSLLFSEEHGALPLPPDAARAHNSGNSKREELDDCAT